MLSEILNINHGIALVVSFGLAVAGTALLLPFLRRLKAGQTEREDGPESHKVKNGTPTMGGLAIILAVLVTGLICSRNKDMLVCLGCMLGFGLIGFVDDFIIVVKKQNEGLTAIQKIVLQVIIAALVAAFRGSTSTMVYIPFVKTYADFGWFFYPFAVFVMVAMTNAVNLTDGLDGLASSVTAVVAFCFALLMGGTASLFSLCICGACLGFLVFNHHPAKLFMGDTGSLALGGALAAASIVSDYEFALPIAGGIYVAEALSVIIQVFVFKTQNGRRFFRMAPLHHHYELGGWKETKVVWVFTAVTVVLSVITLLIL